MSQTVSVLLPYGIFKEDNLQYKTYIDEAVALIRSEGSDCLVICGGLIKSNLSEAKSIENYLHSLPNLRIQTILLEEQSITTPQNLKFAGELLNQKQIHPGKIQIICDSIRAPKVFYLSLKYFAAILNLEITEEQIYLSLLDESVKNRANFINNVNFLYKNIIVHGLDLKRSSLEISQQIISTLQEIAATKFPSIEAKLLNFRKIQWQLENVNR